MRAEELSAIVEALDVRDGAARGVIADLLDDADRGGEAALARSPRPVRSIRGFLYSQELAYYYRSYPGEEGVVEVYCCPMSLKSRFDAVFPDAVRLTRTCAREYIRNILAQSYGDRNPRCVTMIGSPFGPGENDGLREAIERCVVATVEAVQSVEWWNIIQDTFQVD